VQKQFETCAKKTSGANLIDKDEEILHPEPPPAHSSVRSSNISAANGTTGTRL